MLKFITKEKITKSVCNSTSTLSTGPQVWCTVTVIQYDLSAFCECVGCQAPVPCPPADEWRKKGPSRGRTGEGPAWEVFLVESWRDVSVRMRHGIGPRENAFPTRSPLPQIIACNYCVWNYSLRCTRTWKSCILSSHGTRERRKLCSRHTTIYNSSRTSILMTLQAWQTPGHCTNIL